MTNNNEEFDHEHSEEESSPACIHHITEWVDLIIEEVAGLYADEVFMDELSTDEDKSNYVIGGLEEVHDTLECVMGALMIRQELWKGLTLEDSDG